METNTRIVTSLMLAIALLLGPIMSTSAVASTTAGTVIFAVGSSWILSGGSKEKRAVKHGESVSSQDTLITGADGHIHLRMVDQAFIALRPDSQLVLDSYHFAIDKPELDRARLKLERGSLRSVSGKLAQRSKNRYRLNTPVAAIGVRGTDYTVVTTARLSEADVLQGGIAMSPFNANCSADTLGPCSGSSVVDLYASMREQYLQIRSGDETPILQQGRLSQLSHPAENGSLKSMPPSQQEEASDKTDESEPGDATEEEAINETADRDGDGTPDNLDAFPDDPDEAYDTDGDGFGNNVDEDDDGDELSDAREKQLGTNPLQQDTDGDGVDDNIDSRPTHAEGVKIEQAGRHVLIAEKEFEALDVKEISIRSIRHQNTTGTLFRHTMDIGEPADQFTLTRTTSNDGRVFWGIEGSAEGWDKKIIRELGKNSYLTWAQQAGLDAFLFEQGLSGKEITSSKKRWDAYYKREEFTPLVSNKYLYLNNVVGLEPVRSPDINLALRSTYELSTSEVQLHNGTGTPLATQVTDFDFTMLYPSGTFEAELTMRAPGRDNVVATFTGTVNESGMIFGGKSDAYLKGFFVKQMSQVALIFETEQNGYTYAGTLILDHGEELETPLPMQATFETYQADTDKPLKWGRWSNFDQLVDSAPPTNDTGDQLLASNSTFALYGRQGDVTLPSEGVVDFKMEDSEAVYRRGNHLEVASIKDPSLTMDFNQRTFSTELTVASPSLGGIEVRAQGNLQDDGMFSSHMQDTRTSVIGSVTNNAESAAMIFERELKDGIVSGAVEWAQPQK